MLSPKINIIGSAVILSFSLLWGCSTEKDAALNVGYHNMTAKYNGYFNAKEIMAEALEGYRTALIEDYNQLLPLDAYPANKEEVALIQEPYEDAFGRCETVIQRHSMPSSETRNKSEEHCRWIDDNWFVIGQIHYTRRDYVDAEEIFKFLHESTLYTDQERVHEARIWLAKTYIAQGRFPEAKRVLSKVQIDMESAQSDVKEKKVKQSSYQKKKAKQQAKLDKKNGVKKPAPFPKKLTDDYHLTMAEFYIAQELYDKAIPELEKGIEYTKKKKRKARYHFVLAQIYRLQGNGDQASTYFNKVVHSNAPYEMRFQAQIYKALSLSSGGEEIRKELAKMLKDPKNDEYKDQIYYALADIEMKSGNKDKAIENYSKSAFYSINNNRQKGLSYLSLGDIYFNDQDYLKAQKYYDSCVQVLPEDYESYEQIKGKAEGLSDLVFHYETYVFEDSVQKKAQMSPEQLDKYLEKQLKEMKEAEERRKEEEQRRLIAQQNRVKNSGSNTGSGSKWYFYNQKVSSSGFNDFRALWGQRVNEDDWRRSNKTSYSSGNLDDPDAIDSTDLVVDSDSLTVDMLKANLPLTDSAMAASNNRLISSLYMLGIIYKEQLKQDHEAITYFKKLVDRKVEHNKVLPAMYQLYLLYKKKGAPEANRYKEEILRDYPDSEIAMILNDPDYLAKKAEKEKEALNEYSETLENYRYQRYPIVITKCNEVITTDTTNPFLYKYYLLKAFSIGKTYQGNTEAIKAPLTELYELAPGSEEGMEAKMYLDKLSKGISIVKPDTTAVNNNASPYIYDEQLEHYFVVIFPNDAGRVDGPKIQLANFNKEFHKSKQLSVVSVPVGDSQLLIVRTFQKQEAAKEYKQSFASQSAKPYLGNMAKDLDHFLISSTNFKHLQSTGDLTGYLDFYKEKYPQ